MPEQGQILEIGKGRIVREGTKLALLSLGAPLVDCLKAAEELEARGISVTVADARFAKPFDTDLVARLVKEHEALVTVEHGSEGGFGASVLHWLARTGRLDGGLAVRTMTLPDCFIEQAAPEQMYAEAKLTARDIADTSLQALGIAPAKFGAASA
jgi:1-deoxy-D-xylulose-5-phosphate synthase